MPDPSFPDATGAAGPTDPGSDGAIAGGRGSDAGAGLGPDVDDDRTDDLDPGADGWLQRLTEPLVLFPLIAVVALTGIWVVTANLVRVERENARESARATSGELLETYEAQVVRVLREIDRTLKSLRYAHQVQGDGGTALDELGDRDLLPPELVFTVTVADTSGDVLESTSRSGPSDVSGRDVFQRARGVDTLVVGQPERSDDDWRLAFGRRLLDADDSIGGVALVEVDASFFVSGYEASKLGDRGVLAVVGADGVFRARRTGEQIRAGGRVTYDSVVPEEQADDTEAVLATNPWDGVRRYTSARPIYDFPLAVVVALSEEERLAAAEEQVDTYVQRAAAGSVALLLVLAVLGRMSWKLQEVRRRESKVRIAHARRVEHLAYHDGLTGLPNRSFLSKLLEDRIRQANRYDREFAVLFLDLDRFKEINDTLGHDAGDELLREVAERLEATLRESDTVARMGGDEFVVVLPDVEAEEEVTTVARKVLSTLKQPFELFGHKFTVTASIGVSLYPRDGRDEQTLMKNADIAMYQAKDAGRNVVRLFSDEMGSASLERLSLESGLRRALTRKEFDLHYQPRRDLETGRITGMEALLRWEHPEFGTVEPRKFLPLAEETGLIIPIGRWVLKTACEQNVAWQEEGLPRLNMAVNLSGRQFFDGSLVDDVAEALEESGMDPELLELEICESVLSRDARRTVPVLEDLKELGVGITIDNFGTGYSSLSVLRQFPLDTVKIDRLFLRDDGGDELDHQVADAILAMSRSLSSSVVAHGVETEEQADFLREQACNQVQGFYFNRPAPADEFREVLRSEQAAEEGQPAAG
ncbi:MAG: putative bifunctional diguanylate cyclase/phosphodiesterase [Gemmatimonadota bacterium]